jgi:biopolymer transport protein ExbD
MVDALAKSSEKEEPVHANIAFESHGFHHDDEMDMTALIDITFLLLIFFIVTSKLANEVTQPLPIARHGQLVATDKTIIICMRAGAGGNAMVTRKDGKPFSEIAEQQAAEIEEYIQQGFNQGNTDVLIRADGSVTNREVNRVKEIVSESLEEGALISFGVMHEQ